MKNDYPDYRSSNGSDYSSYPSSASSASSKSSAFMKRKSNLGFAGSSIVGSQDNSYNDRTGYNGGGSKYPRPTPYEENSKNKYSGAGRDTFKYDNGVTATEESKRRPNEDYWNSYSNSRFNSESKRQDRDETIKRIRPSGLNETITSQKAIRDVSDYQTKVNDRSVYSRERIVKPSTLAPSTDFSVTGLENIGNTCYLNVILQWLFHFKEFNKLFLNETYK